MIAWFKALPFIIKLIVVVPLLLLASGVTVGGMFVDGFFTNGPGTGPGGYGMPDVPGAAAAGDPATATPAQAPKKIIVVRPPASVPAAAPSPALGGDAYWLADGGTWTVHGLQLQISRGPSGLTGTQTWNAGGNIEVGHAQLAFTSNADGSLTGTYTATGTHTYATAPPAGFIPEPDSALPRQGQTIMLMPVSPHLAKTVYKGNSPSLFVGGNTSLCQADLADASRYCGA